MALRVKDMKGYRFLFPNFAIWTKYIYLPSIKKRKGGNGYKKKLMYKCRNAVMAQNGLLFLVVPFLSGDAIMDLTKPLLHTEHTLGKFYRVQSIFACVLKFYTLFHFSLLVGVKFECFILL